MARVHTHYDNLKVVRDAPPELIRAAYKTLSKKYHPDHNPDSLEAIRIIQLVNSAYDVLSDPTRRQEHDRWIAREEAMSAQSQRGFFAKHSPHEEHNSSSPVSRKSRNSSSRRAHPATGSRRGVSQKILQLFDQLLKIFYRKA